MNILKKIFGERKQKGFTGIDPISGQPLCVICYHTESEGHDPDCWYGNKVN